MLKEQIMKSLRKNLVYLMKDLKKFQEDYIILKEFK
ncbi:hypothetical protein QG7_2475, partial [Clostridioides difficile CD175]